MSSTCKQSQWWCGGRGHAADITCQRTSEVRIRISFAVCVAQHPFTPAEKWEWVSSVSLFVPCDTFNQLLDSFPRCITLRSSYPFWGGNTMLAIWSLSLLKIFLFCAILFRSWFLSRDLYEYIFQFYFITYWILFYYILNVTCNLVFKVVFRLSLGMFWMARCRILDRNWDAFPADAHFSRGRIATG